VAVIAASHATMVALMSMAPVRLRDHGATLTVVGLTISLHVAGMYALSPVFGALSDRLGRLPVILGGQTLLLVALTAAWLSDGSQGTMTVSLIFLGLGWSASVVAGSALVSEAVEIEDRSSLQGFSDLSMNAAGALGGAIAGPILAMTGYSTLGLSAMALVAVVVTWSLVRARGTHA
jgi:MFS family permease